MRFVLLIVLALELLLPGSIRPHVHEGVHTQAGDCQDLQGQEGAGREAGNQGLSTNRRGGVSRTHLHFHFGPARHRHSHAGHSHAGHAHAGHCHGGHGLLGQGHGQAGTAASRPRRFRFASESETSARRSHALSRRHDRCPGRQAVVRDYICSHDDYSCSQCDDYVCSHCDCSHGGDVLYLGPETSWVSTQRQSATGIGLANWSVVQTTWSSELTAVMASVRSVAAIPCGLSVSSHARLPHVLRI